MKSLGMTKVDGGKHEESYDQGALWQTNGLAPLQTTSFQVPSLGLIATQCWK